MWAEKGTEVLCTDETDEIQNVKNPEKLLVPKNVDSLF